MKRKIFSKLLMVALVIAAVGSFVSCKDYDDDINNLQKQIDAKAALSELTALQSTLDSKIAAAQSAATAAQAKADAAATKTSVDELKKALEAAIADAKKAGTDAGTQAGTAITAANKAQETADGAAAAAKKADEDAKAALEAALKTIEETYQTKAEAAAAAAEAAEALAAVKETAEAAFTKAQAEELKAEVEGLKEELETAIDEKIDAKIQEVNNAVASVDAIWGAVTSIEFAYAFGWNNSRDLNFQYGQEVANVFGNKLEAHAYEATDKPKTYVAGDSIEIENLYIVRVSPVNAVLNADEIQLVNTKGETLNDYLNIAVEKYDELLTRGGETGLWRIAVSMKDGFKIEDLQKATHSKFDADNKLASAAVYAIQINNTKEAAAGRFATTAYDLRPLTGPYKPETTFDVLVDGVSYKTYYNRWTGTEIVAEDGTIERSEDNYELKWNGDASKGVYVPATKIIAKGGTDGKTSNVTPDKADARKKNPYKYIEVGGSFELSFDQADWAKIDRYYVLFDGDNAIESAPSEFQAWIKYDIEGLGVMKRSMERLTITVNDEKAEGDIIGFRVYAVNYDGTLADPDGKAFYVQVGEVPEAKVVSAAASFKPNTTTGLNDNIKVIGGKTDVNGFVAEVSGIADLGLADATEVTAANGFPATLKATQDNDLNRAKISNDITVNVSWLESNELKAGKLQEAKKVNKIKYVAVNFDDAGDVIDGATFYTDPVEIKDPDKHNKVVGYIQLALQKGAIQAVDPNKNTPFSWKTGYEPDANGVVTLYYVNGPWNAALPTGTFLPFALSLYANNANTNLSGCEEYQLTFDKSRQWGAPNAGGTWTEYPNKPAGYVQDSITFTRLTPSINIKPQYVGENPVAAPATFGMTKYTASLTVKNSTGDKVSLNWKPNLAAAAKTDASDNTKTDLSAPDYTVLNAQKIEFGNIWDKQTYTITPYNYTDGVVGQEDSKKVTKQATRIWLKFDQMSAVPGAGVHFKTGMISNTNSGGGTPLITAPAREATTAADWAATADINNLTTLLTGVNSVLTTFRPGAIAASDYVSYKDIKVVSGNGSIDEWVKFDTTNPYADLPFIKATTNMLPSTINLNFQITVTDAFGQDHVITVPFVLVP